MKLLKRIARLFKPVDLKAHFGLHDFESRTSKTAQATLLLVSRGQISSFEVTSILRTTDARNMISDIRKMGFIGRSEWRRNPKTKARYRVHFWSGKQPSFKTTQ